MVAVVDGSNAKRPVMSHTMLEVNTRCLNHIDAVSQDGAVLDGTSNGCRT
jgi:hypothetical protein